MVVEAGIGDMVDAGLAFDWHGGMLRRAGGVVKAEDANAECRMKDICESAG
jgi:hypothetical protein